jgi:hypothetical protein
MNSTLEIGRHCGRLSSPGRVVLAQEPSACPFEVLRSVMARAAGVGKDLFRRFSGVQIGLAPRRTGDKATNQAGKPRHPRTGSRRNLVWARLHALKSMLGLGLVPNSRRMRSEASIERIRP